jgi:hypothetical protein
MGFGGVPKVELGLALGRDDVVMMWWWLLLGLLLMPSIQLVAL